MQAPKKIDAEPAGDIAVAVTVSTQLNERRNIVMQTYFPRDAALKEFHGTLDKIGKAVDRQEAKYQLQDLKVALEQHEKTEKQLGEDFKRIDERAEHDWTQRGKQGPYRLSQQEAAQKSTAEQNIRRYRVEIEKIKIKIKDCETVIAQVD